jgi:hypothetical protein
MDRYRQHVSVPIGPNERHSHQGTLFGAKWPIRLPHADCANCAFFVALCNVEGNFTNYRSDFMGNRLGWRARHFPETGSKAGMVEEDVTDGCIHCRPDKGAGKGNQDRKVMGCAETLKLMELPKPVLGERQRSMMTRRQWRVSRRRKARLSLPKIPNQLGLSRCNLTFQLGSNSFPWAHGQFFPV